MTLKSKYEPLVKELVANGVDFSRDAMMLSHSELTEYSELAKKYGYKKPLLHSRGFGFYEMLRRVNSKMQ